MDPYLAELIAEGDPTDEVAVLLRLSDATAAPPQVRLVAQFGTIATCRLPRDQIVAVHGAGTVRSVKPARRVGPSLDEPPGAEGTPLPDQLQDSDVRRPDVAGLPTGAGTVVAHVDWGVDVAHPDFRHPDGRTRLLALWDQRGAAFPDRPNRYGYGRIFAADEIDAALVAGDPYRALGYDPADFDTARGTHGTHTLSISAGNGRGGGPLGIAPDAALIFVHLSTYTAEGPTDLGDSVAYVEAIDFILRTAASGGDGAPPVVVNSSLGMQAGSHLGLSLVEQALDAALREMPGRAFVHSAGNYFNRRMHASGELRPGQEHTLRLAVESGASAPARAADHGTPHVTHSPCEVELWYPGVDRLAVVVTAPDGTRFDPIRGDETLTLRAAAAGDAGPRVIGRLRHRLGDPNNGDNEAVLFLYKGAPAGIYELTLIGDDVADGRFHLWIERNTGSRHARSEFLANDSSSEYTTGTICNGYRTIAVGAYDAHAWQRDGDVPDTGRPLAPFSSSGPTADGRQKPDLCAPGVQVLAARSHPRDWPGRASGQPPPLLTRMSGTSMACPHAAGAAAVLFEAAGRPLAIEDTRRLLLASTDPPPTDAPRVARLRIGSGFLNVEAAVAAVRGHSPPPARALPLIEAQQPMTAYHAGERDGSEVTHRDASDAESWRDYPEYDADRYAGRGEGEIADAAESTRDSNGRSRRDPLPFTFVVPLGGGGIVPALSVPIGGAASPFAFALPLTGTLAPAPAPTVSPDPLAAGPTGSAMRDPATSTATGYDTPVTVADPTAQPLLPLMATDADENDDAFGDRIVAAADALAAGPDARALRSSAVLAAVLDAVGISEPLSPLGPTNGHAPSATELYNAFVHGDDPRRPRHRFREHYARRFTPVAMPGEPLGDADLRAGDVVVRVARGENWGHIAVAICPRLFAATELRDAPAGGYRPGRYALVIECTPVPRRRRDRFARRLTDAAGDTLSGTLVLRVRPSPNGRATEQSDDGGDAWREAIDHTADLSDAFFAAMHAVSATLGTQPEFLLGVMNSESGIRAAAHNPNGHASGLIQFMPATLRALGWTQGHEAFRQLGADEQMPFVQRYFLPHVPRGLDSTARLYQTTFLPSTLSRGSDPDTVLVDIRQNDNTFAYAPNRGLDRRGDGRILVGDLTAFVERAKGSARWREALDRLQLSAPAVVPPPSLVVPPVPVSPQSPPTAAHPVLRLGSRGDAVRELQRKLTLAHARAVAFGGPGLTGAPLAVDGAFGPQTFGAVLSMQQQGFPSSPADWDGVVGPRTWALLDAVSLGAGASEVDVAEDAPGAAVHPTLRRGARGAAVLEAQQKLDAVHASEVARGRAGLRDAPLVEDGVFGRHTFNAVVSFQQQAFPAAPPEWDGVLGPRTWARLDVAALGSGPSSATVTVADVATYVPLDVVLETLTGRAPTAFARQSAFRDRATLDAHIGGTDLLIGGPVRVDRADPTKFETRIRFQLAFPPSRANPDVPAGTERLPLAVLVHGNHAAYDLSITGALVRDHESYKGYRYLQEDLARQGIASISVDTNLANQLRSLIEMRADIARAAIALLKQRASTAGDPLFNRIDFDRVGLMGHSRGGDAVVRMVKQNSAAAPAQRVGIRTVCSLSPTDFTGGQIPADRVFVDERELSFYSVVYGALDGDVSGRGGSDAEVGTGFRHYDRARCPKALVFAERCCHNSFNAVWHADGLDSDLDPADVTSGRLADEATHQALAREYVGGQFAWHLKGKGARARLFSGETASATGLQTAHLWAFGDALRHVDDFEQPALTLAGVSRRIDVGANLDDFGAIRINSVAFNDHVLEQTHVVHADVAAGTRSPFGITSSLPVGQRDVSLFTTFAFDVGGFFDVSSPASIAGGAPPAFRVTLRDTAGATASADVAQFSPTPGRPFFHRLRSGANVTALHLQTVRAPLTAFAGIDLRNVATIQLDLSQSPNGHVFVDDLKLAVL